MLGSRYTVIMTTTNTTHERDETMKLFTPMNVVYRLENGRMISIDLSEAENTIRDEAELLTKSQANTLLKDHPERQVMKEDDWFSY